MALKSAVGNAQAELPGAVWRTSSFSGNNGTCVAVAELGSDFHAVRDSKDPSGPGLIFSNEAWVGFISNIRQGEFA